MYKKLLLIFFFIFPLLSSYSFEDKPLILDKSYVKIGYGIVHLPDNKNVSQGFGPGAIDNVFPKAKYDFKYKSGSSFSIALRVKVIPKQNSLIRSMNCSRSGTKKMRPAQLSGSIRTERLSILRAMERLISITTSP